MRVQHVLDLLGADVLAAADDEVLLAPADTQITPLDEIAEVAGVEVALGVEALPGLHRVGVAEHHLRAARADLALAVGLRNRAADRIAQAYFMVDDAPVRVRAAKGFGPALDAQRDRGRFAAAVYAEGQAILQHGVRAVDQLRGHRRPPAHEQAQGWQCNPARLHLRDQLLEKRRRTDAEGHAVLPDQVHRLGSIPALHVHDFDPGSERDLE